MRRRVIRAAAVLAAVALGASLWLWSGQDRNGRGRLGGPLLDLSADQVSSLEIRRPEGTSVIARSGAGWTLTGLVDDFVDADRFDPVLAQLLAGQGDPVLVGTEPDERRFGFGGDGSVELVFHLDGDRQRRLALGDANPVTQRVYASGAGRAGVFSVSGGLYAAAVRLPDSVRLPRLLPALSLAALDSLHLERRGDRPLPFVRLDDGRWWLRVPGGLGSLVGPAARYHGRYGDRRREHAGAGWALADERRLRELVYRASDTDVVAFPVSGQDTPEALAEVGLAPPYRGVVFFVTGSGSWRLALGEEQSEGRLLVPVQRQGTLVVARAEALRPLEGPLADFLDLGALSFAVAGADSFRLDEPGRPLLWGVKTADSAVRRRERKSVWDPVIPPGWSAAFALAVLGNHLADIQTNLDRLACLEVLPPAGASPLRSDGRWRLRASLPGGEVAMVWLGRLVADGRAAVWDPADGRLLVVEEEILVTLRNLRNDLQKSDDARP